MSSFSATARVQCRETSSAAGPLIPKWVQSSDPVTRVATRPASQAVISTSWDTPDNSACESGDAESSTRGTSAGTGGTTVCPSRGREIPSRAVAAAFRERLSARGKHEPRGAHRSSIRLEREPCVRPGHGMHAVVVEPLDSEPFGFPQERVQDVARPVGVGKQLAVLFFVERNAELTKERDGCADRQRAQHLPHRIA